MIYILLWMVGAVAFLGLWHAVRANGRIEVANERLDALDNWVAQELQEHHGRLDVLENPPCVALEPANDDSYGGTSDED